MRAAFPMPFEENHVHSTHSDGGQSIGRLLEYNHLHDQLNLTFADHVDKNTDWFPDYVKEIKGYRKQYPSFALRIGCEVKILDDGTLNTRPDILKAAEVVIGSVHHFTNIKSMKKEELLEKEYELTKLLAQHPDVDVLGHPFSMCQRFHKALPPREYVEEVLRLCKENDVLFECSAKYAVGPIHEVIEREIAQGGVRYFSFGSDVHDESEIGDAVFTFAPPVTVLVTGAGAGIGQSILKSLKLSKVRTRIIGADMSPLAAGLYRTDAPYVIPGANDPAYIPVLEKICTSEHVDLLLIGTDVELPALALHREDFERKTGTRILVSPPEAIAIADDKWKTAEFLKAHDFPFVRSALADDVDQLLSEVKFPVAVKPRIGARSIGFQIVREEPTLRALLKERPDLIVQEYLPEEDEEFTCGALFLDGECYGVISMKRWLRNGDTYKAIARHDPDLEAFIERVGKALRVTGPCCFQLRKSKGEYKIFEINCRFSGTTGAASALGFNVANALFQHLFFGRPLWRLPFREAHVFRYWNEVIVPSQTVADMTKGHAERPDSALNVM